MPTNKKATLTAQLPPTPCTPEMRESIVLIAHARNMSIADVQRQAFTLFLSKCDTKCIELDTAIIQAEERQN